MRAEPTAQTGKGSDKAIEAVSSGAIIGTGLLPTSSKGNKHHNNHDTSGDFFTTKTTANK